MRVQQVLGFLRTFKPLKEEKTKEYCDFFEKRGRVKIRVNLDKSTIEEIRNSVSVKEIPLEEISTMRMDIYKRQLHILDRKGKSMYIINFFYKE